jgi:hypothetical protein
MILVVVQQSQAQMFAPAEPVGRESGWRAGKPEFANQPALG